MAKRKSDRDELAQAFREAAGRPMVTTREASKLVGVSYETLRVAIRNGHLRAYTPCGMSDRRVACTDLADWIARDNP